MENTNPVTLAIEYIETHLYEKNLPARVAESVYISKFHFHRMFYLTTKMTLGHYVKKKKILRDFEAAK